MPGKIRFARARARHTPGTMNKTEQLYSVCLDDQKALGQILDWQFESVTFKLAKDTRYTPDFVVLLPDGTLECREVKGFWEDDARVKIKVAADKFWWFRFCGIKPIPKKNGGGWEREDFGNG